MSGGRRFDKRRRRRVLSFFSSHRSWDCLTPSPAGGCVSPPLVQGRGKQSLVGEGVGESQFLRGDKPCGTLGINCGVQESAKAGGEAQLELRGRGIPGAMLAPPGRHLHSRSVNLWVLEGIVQPFELGARL
jgi:hypothetical protein